MCRFKYWGDSSRVDYHTVLLAAATLMHHYTPSCWDRYVLLSKRSDFDPWLVSSDRDYSSQCPRYSAHYPADPALLILPLPIPLDPSLTIRSGPVDGFTSLAVYQHGVGRRMTGVFPSGGGDGIVGGGGGGG